MNLTRRGFLGVSLQAGAAFFTATTVGIASPTTGTGTGSPVLLLYRPEQKDVADAALRTWSRISSVNATAALLSDALLFDDRSLRKVLSSRRGGRVVALADACGMTLLNESIRDVGGAILLRGTHVEGDSISAHTLETYGATRGCGSAVSCALNASSKPSWVRETTLGTLFQSSKSNVPYFTRDVRETLGNVLAATAIDAWKPATIGASIHSPQQESLRIRQTFMSLIADV